MRVLSISDAARLSPLSEKSLYRLAQTDPDSPFRKRCGRWMAVETDFLSWVRGGQRARANDADPMPLTRGTKPDRMREQVNLRRVK